MAECSALLVQHAKSKQNHSLNGEANSKGRNKWEEFDEIRKEKRFHQLLSIMELLVVYCNIRMLNIHEIYTVHVTTICALNQIHVIVTMGILHKQLKQ